MLSATALNLSTHVELSAHVWLHELHGNSEVKELKQKLQILQILPQSNIFNSLPEEIKYCPSNNGVVITGYVKSH